MVHIMVMLYNWVWMNENAPSRWREGVIANLSMKGDKADPGNYRGNNTLLDYSEKGIVQTFGFRHGWVHGKGRHIR